MIKAIACLYGCRRKYRGSVENVSATKLQVMKKRAMKRLVEEALARIE
jgi:hypothetical protein